jgi:hypothetical protein
MGRVQKKAILLAIIPMLVLIINLVPTSAATTATVIVDLEYDNLTYNFQQNDKRELLINGTIICYMEGFGKEVQYVEVDLIISDVYHWVNSLNKYTYKFQSNGTQNFTIDITIPIDTENRTVNVITVSGTWEAKTHPYSQYKTSGNVLSDEVNVTINRPKYAQGEGSIYVEPPEDGSGEADIYIIFIIGLICIVIPIIVVIYFYLRKS